MKYCQTDEAAIIDELLLKLGITKPGDAVEFGAGDGFELSNIRHLGDRGWTLHQFDGKPNENVIEAWITAENVNEILSRNGVPFAPEVMSIDIDGNDYWVWKALKLQPLIVCIEYNGCFEPSVPATIHYDPDHRYECYDYYGASWSALKQLGESKGYTYVRQTSNLNMCFVRSDKMNENIVVDPTVPTKQNYHGADPRSQTLFLLGENKSE